MRFITIVKNNAFPLLIIAVVVGLIIYFTQRKEGFPTYKTKSQCQLPNTWDSKHNVCKVRA